MARWLAVRWRVGHDYPLNQRWFHISQRHPGKCWDSMGTKTNMMVFNFRCVKGIDFSRLVELGLLNVEGDDGVSFTWKHPEQTGTDLSLFQRNGVTSLFEVIYIYIYYFKTKIMLQPLAAQLQLPRVITLNVKNHVKNSPLELLIMNPYLNNVFFWKRTWTKIVLGLLGIMIPLSSLVGGPLSQLPSRTLSTFQDSHRVISEKTLFDAEHISQTNFLHPNCSFQHNFWLQVLRQKLPGGKGGPSHDRYRWSYFTPINGQK